MDPKPAGVRSRGEKKSKGERRAGAVREAGGESFPQSEHKERVVRETVSFPRQSQEQPRLVKPVSVVAPVEKKADTDEDDDGYGDDFEDYDDDFDFEEEDDEIDLAPSSRRSSSSSNVPKLSFSSQREDAEMKQIRKSMEIENIQAMNRQNNRTPVISSTPSPTFPDAKPPNKFSRVGGRDEKTGGFSPKTVPRKHHSGLMGFASKQSIAFAPRVKRLENLKASGILNMVDDKSLQLNIVPSTPFEFYHRQLYSSDPPISQVGVPVEVQCRDIDINTDDINMVDKEMQYVYGDDTSLLNAIAKVIEKRKASTSSEEKSDKLTEDVDVVHGSENSNDLIEGQDIPHNSNRLNLFLQASSQLCEDLLQEQYNARMARKKDAPRSSNSIFSSDGESKDSEDKDRKWITFGGDQSEGSNEMVRLRAVSSLCFSTLQAHMLMSSHPYKEDDDEDLRPFRGIYCIWSTSMPGAPSVVLEASGQPTCCCFSASQTFIVIGGTEEGTLHLWDLRESNTLHANRDTIDLRIAKGVRKPCYSTHTSLASSSESHEAPIVQVEALSTGSSDDAVSSLSQFISMDTLGKAIIWVTSQATSDTIVSSDGIGKELDFGLSPWGNVRLLQQRALMCHAQFSRGLGNIGKETRLNFFNDSDCPTVETCMAIIPGNSSAFLFATEGGNMKRVVRYGSSKKTREKTRDRWCEDFSRQIGMAVETSGEMESKHDDEELEKNFKRASSYQPPITCMSVNNSSRFEACMANGDSIAPLVLVGRQDGTVDLFRLDGQEPIQCWNLPLYTNQKASSRLDISSKSAVVYVQWATWNALGSFIAVDASGYVFYFDILKQPNQPIYIDKIDGPLSVNSVKLSSCRSKGMSVFLAVGNSNTTVSNGALKIRKIDDSITYDLEGDMNKRGEEKKDDDSCANFVPPQWASWVGRTTIEVAPWLAE